MKLEFDSEKPIYLQIAESIEDDILTGVIDEKQQVLSTNEMAAMYRINPATAAKGINRLVNQGVLYKKRGIGMFVAESAKDRIKEKRSETFYQNFIKPLLEEAGSLGITHDDIVRLLQKKRRIKMDSTNPILEIKRMEKSYGSNAALRDINIRFDEKQIYGLLGRNGAGKTTLLNIITNRIFADNGEIQWLGKDLTTHPEIIRNVCYMPEKNYFQDLKLSILLEYGQHFFPDLDLEYARRLADLFELDLTKKQKTLSKGQDSIFKIIFGFSSMAPVTIFDEPIIGLDAAARDLFYRELIDEYARNPRMFIISTHLIEELANAFSEIVILKNGSVYCHSTVEDLLSTTYCVSGKSSEVDSFIESRKVLGFESFGQIKLAVVEGEAPDTIQTGLQLSSLSMQKLFVYLTRN